MTGLLIIIYVIIGGLIWEGIIYLIKPRQSCRHEWDRWECTSPGTWAQYRRHCKKCGYPQEKII